MPVLLLPFSCTKSLEIDSNKKVRLGQKDPDLTFLLAIKL